MGSSRDWSMKVGDSRTLRVTVNDNATPPVVVDITGYSGKVVVRKSLDDAAYITLTTALASEALIPIGSDGKVLFYFEPALFGTLPEYDFPYHYEVQVTSPAGKPYTVREGYVTFLQDGA